MLLNILSLKVCKMFRWLLYYAVFFYAAELMQTEVHHIHTLFIMSELFRKGMKEELQLDHSTVDRIFPCLDELLEIHRRFFCRMKERRQESCEAGSERNFVISRIGDILVQQVESSALLILYVLRVPKLNNLLTWKLLCAGRGLCLPHKIQRQSFPDYCRVK